MEKELVYKLDMSKPVGEVKGIQMVEDPDDSITSRFGFNVGKDAFWLPYGFEGLQSLEGTQVFEYQTRQKIKSELVRLRAKWGIPYVKTPQVFSAREVMKRASNKFALSSYLDLKPETPDGVVEHYLWCLQVLAVHNEPDLLTSELGKSRLNFWVTAYKSGDLDPELNGHEFQLVKEMLTISNKILTLDLETHFFLSKWHSTKQTYLDLYSKLLSVELRLAATPIENQKSK